MPPTDPAIAFSGIEGISLTSATGSALTVNGTNGDDAINQNANVIAVNGGAPVTFTSYIAVTLNGLAGADQFNVNPGTLPAGVPLTINAGAVAEGNTLTATALAGTADALAVSPTAAGAGALADVDIGTLATLGLVSYSGIANIQLTGQAADGDAAAVTGTSGDDTLAYTPGADASSGSFSGTLDSDALRCRT